MPPSNRRSDQEVRPDEDKKALARVVISAIVQGFLREVLDAIIRMIGREALLGANPCTQARASVHLLPRKPDRGSGFSSCANVRMLPVTAVASSCYNLLESIKSNTHEICGRLRTLMHTYPDTLDYTGLAQH